MTTLPSTSSADGGQGVGWESGRIDDNAVGRNASSADVGQGVGWLPDEATLNRLAAEFFTALPGATSATPPSPTSSATPPGVASVPGGLDLTATPSVPVAPATAPPGAPGFSAGSVGGFSPDLPDSVLSALGLAPAAPSAPAVPATPPAQTLPVSYGPVSAPAASVPEFYFLEEASRTRPPSAAVPPAVPTAPSFVDLAPYLGEPAAEEGLPAFGGAPLASGAGHPVSGSAPGFDIRGVRADFPILAERINGHPLIWFDNAATTQKPQAVIDRLAYYYAHENSNIHRSAHTLAARSTDAYEKARRIVARFIGAGSTEEIVFARGTTEAINLVASSWGRKNLREGDEIIVSNLEHHANIVPWQLVAQQTGAVIKVIPVDERGELLLGEYQNLLSDRTKLVSVTHVSNALGTVTPIQAIVEAGHRAGAKVLIDGAQSVAHAPVDVAALGADFFVFSGHKIYGPTGIGVLYGKREVLEDMPPYQGGGNMIADVTFERSVFQPPPGRFEAGTGNIADAVGLGEALEYVERIGLPAIAAYEHQLLEHATEGMSQIPGLRIFGHAREKASVLSFTLAGYEPIQVGQALNELGIAVRAGHHCAQPILRRYGQETTVRASLAFYNTIDEVDFFVAALRKLAADSGTR
ncbi:family 2A encapsulin nanocompartment cargo protein cysteine desulfurase [Segniliparus rugosus]|uniref:cysteine desulfurase n=1 Tax=Segniliparus rugosus (strain ATCC BAA-974 / DSM 45345 / CCUG 50838 / CIP 108380 / JCM 13579 / CDC 945) TaxID=679197 RepID=E5XNU1_SEGRC|nr:family 2A encapsulin nanocompartment cargo protein cysteine desulfurase [Segniliparus rugosus]EFV13969.2 cysteine desulfurase, SufS subfamily [Segniliparus rugosus ATCC BAA-974]